MWERPGNIPALVRLICAYMVKGKAQVLALPTIPGGTPLTAPLTAPSQVLQRLDLVLGVFQKLLASRATDSHACKMLGAP